MIKKFSLPQHGATVTYNFKSDAEILHIGVQKDTPFVWVNDVGESKYGCAITCVWTGEEAPTELGSQYIGTVQIDWEVMHFFVYPV
jgi:hypothetical protein